MKALLYIFLLAGAVSATAVVMPDTAKDRALAAIGLNSFSPVETIQNTANQAKDLPAQAGTAVDKFIPKSPQEERAERIARLKQSLTEIREAQQQYEENPTPQAEEQINQTLHKTEQELTALEEENKEEKEGAVSSVLHATADGIRKITGTNKEAICEVPAE